MLMVTAALLLGSALGSRPPTPGDCRGPELAGSGVRGSGLGTAPSSKPDPRTPIPGSLAAPDTVCVKLGDLVRAGVAYNVRLLSAYEDVHAAEAQATSVRSPFDPVVTIGPSYGYAASTPFGDARTNLASRTYGGQVTGVLPSGATYSLGSRAQSPLLSQPLHQNELTASIQQPVLRGLGFGSSRLLLAAADEAVAASRARLARARNEVAAAVADSYYLLVERHRQEAVALRSLSRAQDLLVAYAELRRLGKITEVDLITAQLGVAERRATLLAYRRDRESAQDALVILAYGTRAAAELPPDDAVLVPVDTGLAVPTLPTVGEATTRALAAQPDVEAARRTVEQLRRELAAAHNAWLPGLDVTGGLSRTAFTHDAARLRARAEGDLAVAGWSLGLQLSYPLRNSAASAEVQRATAAERQAGLALTDAENVTRADVRAAVRDIRLGAERMRLASEAARLARAQYEGERARLDLGLTDIFRVLQYEEQVSQVEVAEATAWLDLASSVARYRAVLGEAETALR